MDAKLKCSHCGAEVTNLTLSWGRQWLWSLLAFLPVVAIMIFSNYWMRPNLHYAADIEVSLVDTRILKDRLDVVGTLKNKGTVNWNRISVEAEVFDKNGTFRDETTTNISTSLPPGATEHFRISIPWASGDDAAAPPKIVLKVADAHENRF